MDNDNYTIEDAFITFMLRVFPTIKPDIHPDQYKGMRVLWFASATASFDFFTRQVPGMDPGDDDMNGIRAIKKVSDEIGRFTAELTKEVEQQQKEEEKP